ncbi:MAG: hypothetical protein QNJ67_11190 [Kiloniellales bacterium]|nr:hypothetical protein [Kiloniellales bacterium]
MAEQAVRINKQELIAAYKKVLRSFIDQRPSGMRLRIARVLGTHKSFVSQITSPLDPTPLPVRHVGPIMEVCHLSPAEREAFLAAYRAAHPNQSRQLGHAAAPGVTTTLEVEVPVMDDPSRQKALEDLIREMARRMAEIMAKD